MIPAAGEGTSIVALSVSTVIRDCSTDTASPAFTNYLYDLNIFEIPNVRNFDCGSCTQHHLQISGSLDFPPSVEVEL